MKNELNCLQLLTGGASNLLEVLDLVFVGDESCLVDAVPANQQLVVQSQS